MIENISTTSEQQDKSFSDVVSLPQACKTDAQKFLLECTVGIECGRPYGISKYPKENGDNVDFVIRPFMTPLP